MGKSLANVNQDRFSLSSPFSILEVGVIVDVFVRSLCSRSASNSSKSLSYSRCSEGVQSL